MSYVNTHFVFDSLEAKRAVYFVPIMSIDVELTAIN